MIHDVDDTLRELLVQKVPIDITTIDIKFEMPTTDWSAGVSKPTLNLFLYDLRENVELRSHQRYVTRTASVVTERRAPIRLDLAYMITAWAAEVADEHQLLGRVLHTLLRYPVLPPETLKGWMQSQRLPVQTWIAQPERTPNAWDFWSSLDGRLKPGISCVLTTAFEPYPAEELPIVTEGRFKVSDLAE